MASSSSSERVASEITPADSRVLQNAMSEGVEEKRLKEAGSNEEESEQEIDDLVAATKRLVVESSEAGFDEDSIKKRDKAALIASIAKLESELHEIRAEGQEDILVCPNFYPTGLSKNVKTDAEALGGSSVQEPKIDWKLTAEIDFTSPTNNCWTYSATDVYSSHRLRNEEDEAFRVMSARYLTFYVSKEERERERRHGDRNTHHCHGFRVIHGLRFIKEHGVPEESPRDAKTDYSCIKNPPSRTQKLFHFGADVEFMESDKIEDLQKMLLHQPVSANMILYYPEYDKILTLEEIYEGPTSEKSLYGGIHAVLVLAIIRFLGKLVALVKLSHGTKAGESGYMYVSLSKMIVNVEYSVEKNLLCQLKRKTEDAIAEPSYLLRNFTGVNYGDSPVAVARTSKKRKLN
uniref:Peptidase C1A papain C-terminal domain-containing protein n=1 Tax=Brassica campestris TaxID=3711 RepID=M4E3W6_BRACM